ncbi:MAG: M48 family metallopeptidase [Petrimonas sp.]|nr:MAG: TPR repeat-containing protein YfgC precursor [Bacteroidetes bacterium ADurb.BinA174]
MERKKIIKSANFFFVMIFTLAFLQACGSVPFTGRRQLNLVSNEQVVALSLQQYQEFIRTAPLEKSTPNAEMVKRVGSRIAGAVETFYKNNGYESELQYYQWEFNLVKDKSVNAFAMPGGKIVIFDGLLPVTQTEDALAVVVGHEIAHVIARHAQERISQQMALQYGGAIAGGLLGNSVGAQIGQQVFGLGAQLGVMMPYARKQEYEADEIGLIVMALAGYNPQTAIPFWIRMAQSNEGGAPPEFLSTHPTDDKRIARIQQIMPNILQYYKGTGIKNQTSAPIKTKAPVPVKTEDAKTSKDWTF